MQIQKAFVVLHKSGSDWSDASVDVVAVFDSSKEAEEFVLSDAPAMDEPWEWEEVCPTPEARAEGKGNDARIDG